MALATKRNLHRHNTLRNTRTEKRQLSFCPTLYYTDCITWRTQSVTNLSLSLMRAPRDHSRLSRASSENLWPTRLVITLTLPVKPLATRPGGTNKFTSMIFPPSTIMVTFRSSGTSVLINRLSGTVNERLMVNFGVFPKRQFQLCKLVLISSIPAHNQHFT
jgi:hypothetical protein